MTTPRVTVPVEAVELLKRHMPMLKAAAMPTKSEVFVVCGHEAREMHDAIAMLSAAPAPEGGAVKEALREMLALVLLKYGNTDEAVNAAVERAQAALATPSDKEGGE